MNDRDLLERLLKETERLADAICFECTSRSTEWLDMPAIRRIEADAVDLQEAVTHVRKRLSVSSEDEV